MTSFKLTRTDFESLNEEPGVFYIDFDTGMSYFCASQNIAKDVEAIARQAYDWDGKIAWQKDIYRDWYKEDFKTFEKFTYAFFIVNKLFIQYSTLCPNKLETWKKEAIQEIYEKGEREYYYNTDF